MEYLYYNVMCIYLYIYVTASNNNMTIMYPLHVHIIKHLFAYNYSNAVLNFPCGKTQCISILVASYRALQCSRLKLSISSK